MRLDTGDIRSQFDTVKCLIPSYNDKTSFHTSIALQYNEFMEKTSHRIYFENCNQKACPEELSQYRQNQTIYTELETSMRAARAIIIVFFLSRNF